MVGFLTRQWRRLLLVSFTRMLERCVERSARFQLSMCRPAVAQDNLINFADITPTLGALSPAAARELAQQPLIPVRSASHHALLTQVL